MNYEDFDQDLIEDLLAIMQEYKDNNVLKIKPIHGLRDILQKRKVHQLRELARLSFAIRYSKLKKADLINLLLEILLDPEILETKLGALPIKVMSFFLKVLQADELIDNVVSLDCYILSQELGLLQAFNYEGNMIFVVPDEIKECCLTIIDKGMLEEIEKNVLVNEYAKAAVNLYGVIPVHELADIYNKHNDDEIDGEEMSECLILYGDEGLDFCIWQDYLVYPDFEDDDFEDVEYLVSEIEGKPRYIPPKERFLKYSDYMYMEETEQSKALEHFLVSRVGLDIISARGLLTEIEFMTSTEMSLQEIVDFLDEKDIVFNSQKEFEQFAGLIVELSNNSRIWSNKGHTPNEMKTLLSGKPNLRVIKGGKGKIDRNEPCPCGSGKKYKHCCGKN